MITLSYNDFIELYPTLCENRSYVENKITEFNSKISKKLTPLFSLKSHTQKYYRKNASLFFAIDNWQKGGIVYDTTITNGGSGYTTASVSIEGSATATATITSGVITAITITYPGSEYEYDTAPILTITGDGTGATATTTISDLKVYIGANDSTTADDELLRSDYQTGSFEVDDAWNTYHITDIRTYNGYSGQNAYMRVEGIQGIASQVPADLNIGGQIYDILARAYNGISNVSNGKNGAIKSSDIGGVKVSFGNSGEITGSKTPSSYSAVESSQAVDELLDAVIMYYDISDYYSQALG